MTKTILVVDDSKQSSNFLEHTLANGRYLLKHEDSANKALRRVQNENFDALIIDMFTVAMEGRKLFHALLSRTNFTVPPVILLTLDTQHEGYSNPPWDHKISCITKPLKPTELIWTLEKLMAVTAGEARHKLVNAYP